MQRRPQGFGYRNAQGNYRSAPYSDRGYVRPQYASYAQRKRKYASPLKKLLFGKNKNGQTPVWRMIAVDAVIFSLALVVFAFFHHGMPREEEAVGINYGRNAAPQEQVVAAAESTPIPAEVTAESGSAAAQNAGAPTAVPTPTAAPTPTAVPEPIGYFGTKYADKFTDGKVISNGTSYRSANVNLTATRLREYNSDIYYVDVYVKDVSCLRTEFAEGRFGRGISEWPLDVANRVGSVITINGDYYGSRNDGIVIRNGILYRDKDTDRDVGVLYWDGTMKCFSPKQFNATTEMEKGAYQAWNFGPMLLDENGKAKTKFNSSVGPENPRAAIGYFEPGHYCLVVVDGRSDMSVGLTLEEMSQFFERMGCAAAYNLDGGGTTAMVCGTEMISSGNSRACSDFVVIVDEIVPGF